MSRRPAAITAPLGTAFQLVDDLLDYEGNTETRQERRRRPARRQTDLPLLIAMERGTAAESATDPRAIEHGDGDRSPDDIVEIVRYAPGPSGGNARGRAPRGREGREATRSILPEVRLPRSLLEFICARDRW